MMNDSAGNKAAIETRHNLSSSRRYHVRKSNTAFTLIELLVVITIAGTLIALLFSGAKAFRNNSDKAAALSNLKSIAGGVLSYAADHDNRLPPVFWLDANGNVKGSWANEIASGKYIECQEMVGGASWNRLANPSTKRRWPRAFNAGGFGLNTGIERFSDSYIPQNLLKFSKPSATVMLADATFYSGGAGYFDWIICDIPEIQRLPSTLQDGSAIYAFMDGHVEVIPAQDPTAPNSAPQGYKTRIFLRNP
jgi:prepilin-type N-terminal cleavage/methylation domain-containing protein/prepilin-type processing-associated H-X9-DG protein